MIEIAYFYMKSWLMEQNFIVIYTLLFCFHTLEPLILFLLV